MNRTALDFSVGAGTIAEPWWMQLTAGLELCVAIGGLVLIGFRLAIAVRERELGVCD